MEILELGCGGRLYPGATGVDKVLKPYTQATVQCKLGFEKLPFDDNSTDLVLARHILEHIPDIVYHTDKVLSDTTIHYPTILFLDEVYRVLEHGACIYIELPIYPSIQSFQDPQHISIWPLEKFNYFSGNYYGFHDVYGHKSRFWWRYRRIDNNWLGRVIFQVIKDVPDDSPYLMEYDDEDGELQEKFSNVLRQLEKNEVM